MNSIKSQNLSKACLASDTIFFYCGSEFHANAVNSSSVSMRPKGHIEEKSSENITAEETNEPVEANLGAQLTKFTTWYTPEKKETDWDHTFSTKRKGIVSYDWSSCYLLLCKFYEFSCM